MKTAAVGVFEDVHCHGRESTFAHPGSVEINEKTNNGKLSPKNNYSCEQLIPGVYVCGRSHKKSNDVKCWQ